MWLDPSRGYDIIGDVHGCEGALVQLLEQMGYKLQQGVWRHPRRMALFLGDIIDRGPRIRETLHLVRNMVEAKQAICLMGNHEYYLLCWATSRADDPAAYIQPHTPQTERRAAATFKQFVNYPEELKAFQEWFYHLPLFIENERFRLVHACWDQAIIDHCKAKYSGPFVTYHMLQKVVDKKSFERRLFDRLLLGLKLRLPDGQVLISSDGHIRKVFRAKFWAHEPKTCGDVVFQPDPLPTSVIDVPLTKQQRKKCSLYKRDDPLLFVGHYWRSGNPEPIQNNLACLDYSAVKGGCLAAYRLDDEIVLNRNKFVWVDANLCH